MRSSVRRLRWCVAVLPFALSVALAQEAAPAPAAAKDESARTYTPEDFKRFAPNNALDMLEQVPGFVIRNAVQARTVRSR